MKTETMEGYLKDSNVGVDLVVGGVVTPTDTANHELASQVLSLSLSLSLSLQSIKFISSPKPNFYMHRYQLIFRFYFNSQALLKLRIAFLIVKAAYQFEEGTRLIQPCEGGNSRYLTKSSESELSESGSVGEGLHNSNPSGFLTLGIDSRDENDEVDQQQDGIRGVYNSNPSGFFTLGIDSRDENDEVDQQHDGIRVLV
ncbi:hypothetical protein C1H46_036934 [Malus baccata]|uniref:Uncharacterized protein n=1 Tax=Malus baccata TaxID=106549 RepID=A0A540KU54_MALBA|nr:hypothetical protein C1H46_036934 [Malus baccata]